MYHMNYHLHDGKIEKKTFCITAWCRGLFLRKWTTCYFQNNSRFTLVIKTQTKWLKVYKKNTCYTQNVFVGFEYRQNGFEDHLLYSEIERKLRVLIKILHLLFVCKCVQQSFRRTIINKQKTIFWVIRWMFRKNNNTCVAHCHFHNRGL